MRDLQRKILELIATDRIAIPIKSIAGKIDRTRPKLGKEINSAGFEGEFVGDRCYARVEVENVEKSRRISEAVEEFCQEHPRYGDILKGKIAEKRVQAETHLYFGMNQGCRLTSEDYMQVLTNMGFTPATARGLYSELIEVSRKISRKRVQFQEETERSVLIG